QRERRSRRGCRKILPGAFSYWRQGQIIPLLKRPIPSAVRACSGRLANLVGSGPISPPYVPKVRPQRYTCAGEAWVAARRSTPSLLFADSLMTTISGKPRVARVGDGTGFVARSSELRSASPSSDVRKLSGQLLTGACSQPASNAVIRAATATRRKG